SCECREENYTFLAKDDGVKWDTHHLAWKLRQRYRVFSHMACFRVKLSDVRSLLGSKPNVTVIVFNQSMRSRMGTQPVFLKFLRLGIKAPYQISKLPGIPDKTIACVEGIVRP